MPIYEFVKKDSGKILDLIQSTDDESALNTFLNGSDLLEWEITIREFEPTIVARSLGTTYIGHRYFIEYILLTRSDGSLSSREALLWLEENKDRLNSSQKGYLVDVETPDEEYGESADEILCLATFRYAKTKDEDQPKPKMPLDDDIPF